jgi:hypothetical protein
LRSRGSSGAGGESGDNSSRAIDQYAEAATGTARIRPITAVRDFGTSVEVSTGVAAGDRVILNPQVDLADGRKVTIRPDPPKPDQKKS